MKNFYLFFQENIFKNIFFTLTYSSRNSLNIVENSFLWQIGSILFSKLKIILESIFFITQRKVVPGKKNASFLEISYTLWVRFVKIHEIDISLDFLCSMNLVQILKAEFTSCEKEISFKNHKIACAAKRFEYI